MILKIFLKDLNNVLVYFFNSTYFSWNPFFTLHLLKYLLFLLLLYFISNFLYNLMVFLFLNYTLSGSDQSILAFLIYNLLLHLNKLASLEIIFLKLYYYTFHKFPRWYSLQFFIKTIFFHFLSVKGLNISLDYLYIYLIHLLWHL